LGDEIVRSSEPESQDKRRGKRLPGVNSSTSIRRGELGLFGETNMRKGGLGRALNPNARNKVYVRAGRKKKVCTPSWGGVNYQVHRDRLAAQYIKKDARRRVEKKADLEYIKLYA